MISRRSMVAAVLALPLAARAAAPSSAPVQSFLDGLAALCKSGKSTPFAARAAGFAPIVDTTFDLQAILIASIGPRWTGFSSQAQADLLFAFRAFTVATWVANFDSDEGQRFELTPTPRPIGADEAVISRIIPLTGEPTRLDFLMRNANGTWKAIDILIDGAISRTAVQRSDFRTLLKDGSPSPLIESLTSKTADLSH